MLQLQRSSTFEGAALAAAAAAAVAAAAALAATAAAVAGWFDVRHTHYRKSPWAAGESGWAEGCWGRSRR